jgi:P-type conjugative transfer protein TrbG
LLDEAPQGNPIPTILEAAMTLKILSLMMAVAMTACATHKVTEPALDEATPATRLPDPPKPVEIVEVPQLFSLPGQLKNLIPGAPEPAETLDPLKRITQANESARIQPAGANFVNATQVWPYTPDALYQVYTSPEKITDIALEDREDLVSVSAGDTVRWIIGDTTSGAAGTERVHILVKPTRADLKTNLVITTNRRTYHVELTATPQTWMSSVSWAYPLDQLMVRKSAAKKADEMAPVAQGILLEHLNFRYRISGDTPPWRPLRAFDDGEKVYLEFPANIAQGDLPPLFIAGPHESAELVNYRVRSPYYIIDRLFAAAELRLGVNPQARVRIERSNATVSGNARGERP